MADMLQVASQGRFLVTTAMKKRLKITRSDEVHPEAISVGEETEFYRTLEQLIALVRPLTIIETGRRPTTPTARTICWACVSTVAAAGLTFCCWTRPAIWASSSFNTCSPSCEAHVSSRWTTRCT
ncbi:MAG: hypothetical protein FWE88_04660 [Phycisphaerae bacterium]|nr:hypothetical protein [Phycisphaerae bacterium]